MWCIVSVNNSNHYKNVRILITFSFPVMLHKTIYQVYFPANYSPSARFSDACIVLSFKFYNATISNIQSHP